MCGWELGTVWNKRSCAGCMTQRLGQDHASSDVVSRIAGWGQAKSDNKTRRRKPLKAERPISVSSVASPDIEKLQVMVNQRQAGVDAAAAVKQSATLRVSTLLPAEKASAEAALAQAQV